MEDSYSRGSQRLNLNLSNYACGILEEDLSIFNDGKNITGFLNKIFLHSYETSLANISQARRTKKEELSLPLLIAKNRSTLSKEEERIIETYLDSYTFELAEKMKAHPNGQVFKLRLSNQVYDILYKDNTSDISKDCYTYYKGQGQFFKAIVEDYVRKPLFERETIIYKEALSVINNELEKTDSNMSILKITYLDKDFTEHTVEVKPYRLTTKWETPYNYLICLSKKLNHANDDYKLDLIRLSRIISVSPYAASHGKGNISLEKRKEIKTLIDKRAVTFLKSDNKEYTVSLTPEGISMYNSILHLRPSAIADETFEDENGNTVMSFLCSDLQFRFYFFKFGKEVTVLKPQEMADTFKKMYSEALGNYKL